MTKKNSSNSDRDLFVPPSGTQDILPEDWACRDGLVNAIKKIAEFYNFERIETPVFENAAFLGSVLGEETDAVEKELYTIFGKGTEEMALRPDGTPGLVRAYLAHRMARTNSFRKLWYSGPMFRACKVDDSHWRQFHQIGFDILGGVSDPLYDAQIILMSTRFLEEAKLKNVIVRVNSTGCRVCRPLYVRQLQSYYKTRLNKLCSDCERRYKTNTFRLINCDEKGCVELRAEAPNFFDKLCSPCSTHLSSVLEYLDEVAIPYTLDNFLLSDFDYYNRTIFQISVEGAGEEYGNLVSGGRYDYLFEKMGGKGSPAVGTAIGLDRVVAAMRAQGIVVKDKPEKRVFVIHVGELAKKKLLSIIETLRSAGIPVGEALSRESLGAQLKLAEKEGAYVAVILGQKEIFEESVIVRDLKRTSQETVPIGRMLEEVKKRLK